MTTRHKWADEVVATKVAELCLEIAEWGNSFGEDQLTGDNLTAFDVVTMIGYAAHQQAALTAEYGEPTQLGGDTPGWAWAKKAVAAEAAKRALDAEYGEAAYVSPFADQPFWTREAMPIKVGNNPPGAWLLHA